MHSLQRATACFDDGGEKTQPKGSVRASRKQVVSVDGYQADLK